MESDALTAGTGRDFLNILDDGWPRTESEIAGLLNVLEGVG
jgi:hypothetical protein